MLDGIQNDIYEDQSVLIFRHWLARQRSIVRSESPYGAELPPKSKGGDDRGKDQTHNGCDEVRQGSR